MCARPPDTLTDGGAGKEGSVDAGLCHVGRSQSVVSSREAAVAEGGDRPTVETVRVLQRASRQGHAPV